MIDVKVAIEMYEKMYSLRYIAKELGCSKNTIKYNLIKNNVLLRPNNFIKVSPEEKNKIIKLYISGKSLNYISKKNSYSIQRIKNILLKNDIKIINVSESKRIYHQRSVNISDKLLEIIYGELLGDGHIRPTQHQAFFQYNTSNKEYCMWLKKQFNNDGIKTSKIYKINNGVGVSGNILVSFHFKTISTIEFKDIREKWYDNIKIVPEDLNLTPTIVRHWWIGDGSLSSQKFATNGFLKRDVDLLVNKLNNIGIKSKRYKDNTIYVSRKSIKELISFIGKCPVKSYNYKWGI